MQKYENENYPFSKTPTELKKDEEEEEKGRAPTQNLSELFWNSVQPLGDVHEQHLEQTNPFFIF